MSDFKKVVHPIRVHIDLSQETQLRYWTKHLGVSSEELQKAIEKVGNSASAVRKQLALSRQDGPNARARAEPANSCRAAST